MSQEKPIIVKANHTVAPLYPSKNNDKIDTSTSISTCSDTPRPRLNVKSSSARSITLTSKKSNTFVVDVNHTTNNKSQSIPKSLPLPQLPLQPNIIKPLPLPKHVPLPKHIIPLPIPIPKKKEPVYLTLHQLLARNIPIYKSSLEIEPRWTQMEEGIQILVWWVAGCMMSGVRRSLAFHGHGGSESATF